MTKTRELFKFVSNSKDKVKLSFRETIFWKATKMCWKLSYNKYLSKDICQEKKGKNLRKKD